jgi:hypothetical protein
LIHQLGADFVVFRAELFQPLRYAFQLIRVDPNPIHISPYSKPRYMDSAGLSGKEGIQKRWATRFHDGYRKFELGRPIGGLKCRGSSGEIAAPDPRRKMPLKIRSANEEPVHPLY